ncbi:DUF4395 domain-containing protein [Ferroacidibacillus organovorans]|uniref:DUF4395 domain-containing protein n=1 Tax=Ferroacidibacillus organovorans TaxID=1765683 RepID=A0A101XP15_9BACL|nr:DUF4395 domain-containing protein [Ferroacidibacillus organovorans]KUO94796.1 hypothetical protein ATW55_10300 [Ferroacidibacillus organovorans]
MNQTIPRPLIRANQWIIVLSVIVSLLFGATWVLLVPLLAGISGLVFGKNPIMLAAKAALRKPLSSYIQEDRTQQQFNQWIAVSLLAACMLATWFHQHVLALIFETMVGLAAAVAIAGFCVGCFVRFQWKQYQYRRRTSQLISRN